MVSNDINLSNTLDSLKFRFYLFICQSHKCCSITRFCSNKKIDNTSTSTKFFNDWFFHFIRKDNPSYFISYIICSFIQIFKKFKLNSHDRKPFIRGRHEFIYPIYPTYCLFQFIRYFRLNRTSICSIISCLDGNNRKINIWKKIYRHGFI